jgi:hypothetical protein
MIILTGGNKSVFIINRNKQILRGKIIKTIWLSISYYYFYIVKYILGKKPNNNNAVTLKSF